VEPTIRFAIGFAILEKSASGGAWRGAQPGRGLAYDGLVMNLREQVDSLLPGWESWYPSLFDAACDLGLIRARVCSLSSLLLSNRHASVQNEAIQSFRQQWSVEDDPGEQQGENPRHFAAEEPGTPDVGPAD
jgi:hypothetical protein